MAPCKSAPPPGPTSMGFAFARTPAGAKADPGLGRCCRLPSKPPAEVGGGPMALVMEEELVDWGVSDSSPALPAFGFLVSPSRGWSWHKWPMLRLMQRVQGRSYALQSVVSQAGHGGGESGLWEEGTRQRRNWRSIHTRSQVMCYKISRWSATYFAILERSSPGILRLAVCNHQRRG